MIVSVFQTGDRPLRKSTYLCLFRYNRKSWLPLKKNYTYFKFPNLTYWFYVNLDISQLVENFKMYSASPFFPNDSHGVH
jgi:hypothetical protein